MSKFGMGGLLALCIINFAGCGEVVEGEVNEWATPTSEEGSIPAPDAPQSGAPLSCDVDSDLDGAVSSACGGDDCNDTRADIYPGAVDNSCDGVNQDCFGDDGEDLFRDGESACGGVDADQDGVMDVGVDDDGLPTVVDCDDTNPAIFPGALEVCNGDDDDCDGAIDSADPSLDPTTVETYFADSDGDGHGDEEDPGTVSCTPVGVLDNDDCDDSASTVFPGAFEVEYDGVDQDCDGEDLTDADCDGFEAEPFGDDCDDSRGDPDITTDGGHHVNVMRQEICNGVDDDCDGLVDDADGSVDLSTSPTFWVDADGDGFGDEDAIGVVSCTAPVGFVANNDDCDDSNAAVSPDMPEIPGNGVDDDCIPE